MDPATDDAVVDIEFEVMADDLHSGGRALNRGRRSPTLIYAVILVAIGAAFWWLGNPIGAGFLVVLALVAYTNPRIGFLDRWWARRMPGNQIGTRWHIRIGPRGFTHAGEGVSGHIEWRVVESVIVGEEAVLAMGSHNLLLVNIPRRAMTAWQVAAFVDLVSTFAPNAKLIR